MDVPPERAFDSAGLKAGNVRHSLVGLLLVLAALLWPCEIALRRLIRRRTLAPAEVSRSDPAGQQASP
jgi:hypothetical protein